VGVQRKVEIMVRSVGGDGRSIGDRLGNADIACTTTSGRKVM